MRTRNIVIVQPVDSKLGVHLIPESWYHRLDVGGTGMAQICQDGVLLYIEYTSHRNCDIIDVDGNIVPDGGRATIPYDGGVAVLKARGRIQVCVLPNALCPTCRTRVEP